MESGSKRSLAETFDPCRRAELRQSGMRSVARVPYLKSRFCNVSVPPCASAIWRLRTAGNGDLVLKLREVVASTMGGSLHEVLTASFDVRLAETSLRFFESCDIPAIRGQLPPGVSDVHFTADLSPLHIFTALNSAKRGS